ncbi:MAG: polyprenyl synthetase family protein [Methanocellales archaeon]
MITNWKEYKVVNESLSELVKKLEVEPEIRQIIEYVLLRGGKRSRPVIVLLSTEICNGNSEDAINAALAIELVHTVSLIQDDILDRGKSRRGKPSAYVQFGPELALLCSDLLISKAVELISSYEKIIVREFAKAGLLMSEGEILDLKKHVNKISDYYECISKKTAALFSASASIGGMIARRGRDSLVESLASYGTELGIAYQMVDDLLEFFENHEIQKFNFLSSANSPAEVTKTIVEAVREHSNLAKQQLDLFSESEAKQKLLNIVDLLTIHMLEGFDWKKEYMKVRF